MSQRYLLPCPQGHEIPIETSQAGLVVHCSCGASAQAPGLRGIRELPLAQPEPAGAPSRRDDSDLSAKESEPDVVWRRGALLTGLTLLLLCVPGYAYWRYSAPPHPSGWVGDRVAADQASFVAELERAPPEAIFATWDMLVRGPQVGSDNELWIGKMMDTYQRHSDLHAQWLRVIYGAAIVGSLLAAGGALAGIGRNPRRAPRGAWKASNARA